MVGQNITENENVLTPAAYKIMQTDINHLIETGICNLLIRREYYFYRKNYLFL